MPSRRSLRNIVATAALLGSASLCVASAEPALKPFTTDGCSLFPDRALLGSADWCSCCLVHDIAYWRGGTADERLQADEALKTCVQRRTGDLALAELMFVGVRAGGGPQTNSPFRWGYGWPTGRNYTPLSKDDWAAAFRLERAYRETNPSMQCMR